MLLLLTVGCNPGDSAATLPDRPLDGLVLTVDSLLPSVVHASWDAGPSGESWLEYGEAADDLGRRSPSASGVAARSAALGEGRTWYVRAVTLDEAGDRWESAVASVDIEFAPAELPRFTLGERDDAEIDPEAVVFTSVLQSDTSWLVGLDRSGDYVWWWHSDGDTDIDSVHLAPGGESLTFTHFRQQERPYAGVVNVAIDGSAWSTTYAPSGHHDAVELPDGTVAYIAAEQLAAVELEDGSTEDLASDRLQLAQAGATAADAPTSVFSWAEDYGHSPWRVCHHFDDEAAGGGHDYTHTNSVMYDEERDELLIVSKNLDALLAVDRTTGAVAWQAGGRYGDVVDVDGDDPPDSQLAYEVDGPNHTWWSHGHMSQFWGTGFTMFDNGYHHKEQVSRVVEYTLDRDAHTLQKVWEFTSESAVFNPLLGDVRKLDNGNYLVSWTIQGMITEITPAGEVVWRVSVDLGAATGRLVYVPGPTVAADPA